MRYLFWSGQQRSLERLRSLQKETIRDFFGRRMLRRGSLLVAAPMVSDRREVAIVMAILKEFLVISP